MNISFTSDGNDMVVKIDTEALVDSPVMWFRCSTSSPAQAAVLAHHFQDKLQNRMEHIRQRAALKGYKMGHDHGKKPTWFSSSYCLREDEIF